MSDGTAFLAQVALDLSWISVFDRPETAAPDVLHRRFSHRQHSGTRFRFS
jgi:hypothetical protein